MGRTAAETVGRRPFGTEMKPKAIFFDLDNTLLDHRRAAREALSIIHEKYGLGVRGVERDDFVEGYFRVNGEMWFGLAAGETTVERLRVERFDRLFKELGIPGAAVGEVVGPDYLQVYVERVYPFDGAEETLAALAGVFPLGLATNGFADTQREKLAETGWEKYFDWVVIAGEVGVFKPDPAFFRLLVEKVGAEPGGVIFVGDSPAEDIVPARGAGLTTVWLRTPGAWDPGAHYAISEIGDILDVPPVARWMGE
ncbi:MAG: HAD-IA family hydrolase [Candidatus Coatesbacteria bacterium]|nr:MAG: HAD-IA family hydrolase [Candidatus Coatesbacteria bacterium]